MAQVRVAERTIKHKGTDYENISYNLWNISGKYAIGMKEMADMLIEGFKIDIVFKEGTDEDKFWDKFDKIYQRRKKERVRGETIH